MPPTPGVAGRSLARVINRFPVTKTLTDIFGGVDEGRQTRNARKATHDLRTGWRTEIVSESLCDDILKNLAPSLEPYKGCTIIDVHPGACLWSSKLHDFLKPKRHVLMEPDERYWDTFVKPLIEKPGSTYTHSTLIGAHPYRYLENYDKLTTDGEAMSPRPPLDYDDPKLRQLDTSILLIGNLARNYLESRANKNVKFVPLVLQHMANAALTNEVVHRRGLVKMLWWIPEEYKTLALPVTMRMNKQFDHSLKLGTNLEEIAGVEPPEVVGLPKYKPSPRPPRLTVAVYQEVQKKMASKHLEIKPERIMSPGVEATDEELEHLNINPLDTDCKTVAQLTKAIDKFAAHLAKWKTGMFHARSKGRIATTGFLKDSLAKLHYPQVLYALAPGRMSNVVLPRNRSVALIDLNLSVLNLEANYSAVAERHPAANELSALRKRVIELGTDVVAVCEELDQSTSRPATNLAVEDFHAYYSRPRVLERDRRDMEPVRADYEEFWPQQPLALLSMTPHERELGVKGVADRKEGVSTGYELLLQLFQNPARPLPTCLARVAFNAAHDLIPKVPAITDARKGGRLNPMSLLVRCMTTEMTEGLIKAFLEWPFRPEKWQLALLNTETTGGEEEEGVVGEEGD